MKVTKVPAKRLAEPAPALVTWMEMVQTADLLAPLLAPMTLWPFPKSDLYHWIPILNRMDASLEGFVQKYGLEAKKGSVSTMIGADAGLWSSQDKDELLAILKLSTFLWEHCTNRSLYASYEHLANLLNTADTDILLALVRFLLRPASRLSSQRFLKTNFASMLDRLYTLAGHWSIPGLSWGVFKDGTSETLLKEASSVKFYFYRLTPGSSAGPVPPSESSVASDMADSKADSGPGLVPINVENVPALGLSTTELFGRLQKEYAVPEEHSYSLFHKIRIANSLENFVERGKILVIRLYALAVSMSFCTHEVAQSKFFLYEPDLVQKLAGLLSENGSVSSFDLQMAALYALETVCHYRPRLPEVLTALHASVNHGTLLSLMRQVVAPSTDSSFPIEFLDAVYNLVGYLVATQSGGTMLISAGIIPILLMTLEPDHVDDPRNDTKCINLLDNILYGFSSSFNVFMTANGLDLMVHRIKKEVDGGLAWVQETSKTDCATVLPHERAALLRSLLKFIMHLMQTSGNADRMRNLIDTTLPGSLSTIFEHAASLGANVFGIAINIMSTFIHNEPTSLAILQEAKITQTFLSSVSPNMPVSAEVISAIPNAFGAICLNAPGLEAFNAASPLNTYFQLMVHPDNTRSLQDNDVPHLIGNSIDELIRHHPSLKEPTIKAIVEMLAKVVEKGESPPSGIDIDKAALHVAKSDTSMEDASSPLDSKDSDVAILVDISSRFLEGLFQNVAHCRDFIRLDGADLLLRLYSIQSVPFDFASSPSSFSLSFLFRVMVEVNATHIVTLIVRRIKEVLAELEPLTSSELDASNLEKFIHFDDASEPKVVDEAQKTFRSLVTLLGLVRLLSDMYCTHSLSHSKSLSAIVQTFSGELGTGLFLQFGRIQRACLIEKRYMKEVIPASWYEKPKKEDMSSKPADPALVVVGIGSQGGISTTTMEMDNVTAISPGSIDEPSTSATQKEPTTLADPNDPRVKNSQMIWHLVNEIPSVLAGLSKGIVKLLWSRRVADSSNRKAAQSITDEIASVIYSHMAYDRLWRANEAIKASYISTVLNFLFTLIIDDRSTPALQTSFVLSLVKAGFVTRLVDLLKFAWAMLSTPKEKSTHKILHDYRSVVERCLNICTLFCSSKMLLESPQTGNLTREKDRSSPDFFDTGSHLVTMRLSIFPVAVELLNSPNVKTMDPTFVKSLIHILLHVFRAEGETSTTRTVPTSILENVLSSRLPISNLAASLFGARSDSLAADPEKVQQLCDMGFPRSAAERALIRCGNNISRATDYILSHPELMDETQAHATNAEQPSSSNPVVLSSAVLQAAVESLEEEDIEDSMDEDEDIDQQDTAKGTASVDKKSESLEEIRSLKDDLDELRMSQKDVLLDKVFEILLSVPNAIFEIKEFVFLLNGEVGAVVSRVVESMDKDDIAEDSHDLQTYLRFLALIANDHKHQKAAVNSLTVHYSKLLDMVMLESVSEASLTSLLLILESIISLTDEPVSQEATHAGSDLKRNLLSTMKRDDEVMLGLGDSNLRTGADLSTATSKITTEERTKLLDAVLFLMKNTVLASDLHHACLRLLVRLTRAYDICIQFVHLGGLALLLQPDRLFAFPAQQQLTLLVLRHLLENPETLKGFFETEIKSWFQHNRPRSVDISSYLKNFSYLACRDPVIFKDATIKLCKLTKYDATGRHHSLTLKPGIESGTKNQEKAPLANTLNSTVSDVHMAETPSMSPKTNEISHQVMKTIISDLLSTRIQIKDNAVPQSSGDLVDSDDQHIQRCYALQCLADLITSYPQSRHEVLFMCHKKVTRTPSKSTSMKNTLVSFLLLKLYPDDKRSQASESISDEKKRKVVEGVWAAKVLSGLCIEDVASDKTTPIIQESLSVRRIVLEAIAKNLKDSVSHVYDTVDDKYSRFLALAGLVQQILNQKPSGPGFQRIQRVDRASDDHSLHIARLMLDRGYVGLLSNMISDIDVHHPSAMTVMSSLLVPVELLSRFAVKISRSMDEKEPAEKEDSAESPESRTHQAIAPEHEDSGELSNIFRHSALSMFGPRTEPEEYEFSSEDEDGFEEFTDDDSMEDDSEMDDESDVEDEMEIMIPEPFHGAHDEEESDMSDDTSQDTEPSSDDASSIAEADDWEDVDDGSDQEMDEFPDAAEVGSDEDLEQDDTADLGEHIQDLEQNHSNLTNIQPDNVAPDLENIDDDSGDDDEPEDLEEIEFSFDEMGNTGGIPTELLETRHRLSDPRRMMQLDVGPDGLEIHWAQGDRGPDLLEADNYDSRLGVNQEDALTHPFLQEQREASSNRPRAANIPSRTLLERSNDLIDWQAFDDAVGGNALQILEQIFSRTRGQPAGSFRIVEVPGGTTALASAPGGMVAGISLRDTNSSSNADLTGEREQEIKSPSDPKPFSVADKVKLLHSFRLKGTTETWRFEMKLIYGTSCHEKAMRLTNAILTVLVPIAKEEDEERRKREELEKKAKEEEMRKKEEERRLKEEEERIKKAEEESILRTQQAEEMVVDNNSGANSADSNRVIVTINGNPVDITGTGIDVTFLEALPDEMRQEVITQHFREQGLPMPTSATANTILNPEFLDALPEEIREELLRQERLETERENRSQETRGSNVMAGIFGPPFSAAIPSTIFSQSLSGRQHAPVDARRAAQKVYENRNRKDTAQLLDRTALMNLIRLIFVPDNTSNSTIYNTLVNLSENSKTRTELCLLLLSILADGSRDLAAVDKNFTQMTIKSKGKILQTPRKVSLQSLPGDSSGTLVSIETIPNLVAQRCLEALTKLVESNILVVDYLLSESDQLPTKTPSKKGKSKEITTTYNYPVVILLRLLENLYFLENPSLLEQLTGLLTVIFKEFPKIRGASKTQGTETPKEGTLTPAEAAVTPAQTPTPRSGKKISTSSISDTKSRPIPAHHLRCFVSVLRDGTCSSKTFQNTLSVIQNISRVKDCKDVISSELVESSQQLGHLVSQELTSLVTTFETIHVEGDLKSRVLTDFSSTTANQARLLRLLKALDFIQSKDALPPRDSSCGDDKSKPESAESKTSSKISKKEDRRLLESPPVYDKINLSDVWHQLSLILSAINERPEMIHIATVLLPLIETFMVVSKPYVLQKKGSATTTKTGLTRQPSSLEPTKYDLFVAFTDHHRKILNTMVRNNPSLMGGSFSLLVDNPKVLEFDNKRTFFNQQLHKKTTSETYGSLQINVRRAYVFEDSFHQLQGRSGQEIKLSKLNVRFHEEEGVDAGGVTREWYTVLARQMFNPNYALFRPSAADKVTYQPNRASGINPDHLSFFKFIGRVIGKAIYDGHLLDCYFTRSFYKFMLGIEVDYKDMEAIDPEFHKSLEWILNNDITDILDLTFVHEIDDFGHQRVVELKPDGKNIPVTEENKHEYVQLTVQQKLVVAIKEQIAAFLTGFHEVIPKDLIKIFNEQELELLISGMPEIDIDDWKNNTEYQNYTPSSPQIQWFWRAVRSFSQEERAKLIQFVTGTSKVPLEGFSHLQGSSGVQKFQIHKDFGDPTRLPSAHTCFNQLDLPQYESYEQLRVNLFTSISECGTGFGFA